MFKQKLSRLARYSIPFFVVWRAFLGTHPCVSGEEPMNNSESRVAYFVLLDDSKSMSKPPQNPSAPNWSPKIEEVNRQTARFFDSLAQGTEVRLFAFSRELTVGPKVVIRAVEDRAQLKRFVAQLSTNGTETRLWRSVDTVLAEAKELAEQQPGLRVRVLAYSDGEDNESPNPTDPAAVMEKYKPFLRQSQVQLTYVTIGFELEASLRKTLEEAKVQVRNAVRPEDVIPVQAEFHVTPSAPLVGQLVLMVDDSIGVIRERSIDWGDGSSLSYERSPTHTFTRPGEYTVTLRVVGTSGEVSTNRRTLQIGLPPRPKASFLVSVENPRVGEPVLLVNASRGDGLIYAWDLGDGRSSHEPNVRLAYRSPGKYVIRQKITDRYGREELYEATVTVRPPDPPQAAVVPPVAIRQGAKGRIIDRSTGEISERRWIVDGVELSTARDLEWSSPEVGKHEGALTVRGPGGESTVNFVVEVIGPDAPQAAVAVPASIRYGETISLFDRTIGEASDREWNIDGQVISTDRDATWTSTQVGDHQGYLQVRGPGGESRAPFVIRVSPPDAPVARFVVGTSQPRAGQEITFTDLSGPDVDKVEWEFGAAGETRVMQYGTNEPRSTTYTFLEPGAKTIRLRVQGKGGTDECEQQVQVESRHQPPVAKIGIKLSAESDPQGKTRCEFCNDSSGSVDKTIYDFGDGSPPVTVQGWDAAQHAYEPGEYLCSARVFGPDGFESDAIQLPVKIKPPLPRWVRHAWWWLPMLVVATGISAYLARLARRRRRERRERALTGSLLYKPEGASDGDAKTVFFDGSSQEVCVPIDETTKVRIRSQIDMGTLLPEQTVEVIRANDVSLPTKLTASGWVKAGGYEFELIST